MMEAESKSCVPPGFRFHPTDEELVGYYLRKKVASQKIDLDVITDIDLYRIEPWDLQDKCRIGIEEQNEWYFFSHKDKKYPTGTRTNRATIAGFWKATGRDKAVYDRSKLIGMRKTLVFYKGRAPNGHKTDWIMHEYRLESSFEENAPLQEEGWVVCRAFKKRSTGQQSKERWEPTYYYDESSSSVVDPTGYIARRPPNMIASCKEEIEGGDPNLQLIMQSDQLPLLESPVVPMKRSCPNYIDHQGMQSSKKVMDWRDLDKFVASQLSHGDHVEEARDSESDFGLLLLQGGGGGGTEQGLEEFNRINSTSDSDIGICIFNK